MATRHLHTVPLDGTAETASDTTLACQHWDGTQQHYCGATPTRSYLTGRKCDAHRPAGCVDALHRPAPVRYRCLLCPQPSPWIDVVGTEYVTDEERRQVLKLDAAQRHYMADHYQPEVAAYGTVTTPSSMKEGVETAVIEVEKVLICASPPGSLPDYGTAGTPAPTAAPTPDGSGTPAAYEFQNFGAGVSIDVLQAVLRGKQP